MAGVLYNLLSGAVALGFLICGMFFLRFWIRTRDSLFLSFSLSFLLLGVGQAVLAVAQLWDEDRGALYLIRLGAFLLILVAIYRKNRPRRSA